MRARANVRQTRQCADAIRNATRQGVEMQGKIPDDRHIARGGDGARRQTTARPQLDCNGYTLALASTAPLFMRNNDATLRNVLQVASANAGGAT